jgi:hypothetical protein
VTGRRKYVCANDPDRGGCGRIAILAEPTEAEVVARVLARLDSPAMRDALAAEAVSSSPTDPLGERAEAEARMAELAGDYAAGGITRGEWQAARAVLVERLAALPAAAASTLRLPANVADAWPTLDLEQRRKILAAVVDRITVTPAVGPRRFDPNRIAIEWRA